MSEEWSGEERRTDAHEWNGLERRTKPYEYDIRSIIRDELQPIRYQQELMRKEQMQIREKIQDWESGAKWFRVFIIGTVSLITMGSAVWEWTKTHVK